MNKSDNPIFKTDINVGKYIREMKSGEYLYLEINEGRTFPEGQRCVQSYARRDNVNISAIAVRGVSMKSDKTIPLIRIERLENK